MVKKKIKNIIILGAGFAGLNVAQILEKELVSGHFKIILIDKSPYHVYTPNLYEAATAYSEKLSSACPRILKESVAMEIASLIDSKKIDFINAEIIGIDPKSKTIQLKSRSSAPKFLNYDILVLALGAITNYCNIRGLKENSYSLKTVEDALKINCDLNRRFVDHLKNSDQKKFIVTVGGGGATGIETAAELRGYLNHLAKKNNYDTDKIQIHLIEACPLLAGLGEKGTEIIRKRFKRFNITVHLNSFIKKVTAKNIIVQNAENKKTMYSDFFIWTGGVMINPLVKKAFGTEKTGGAIEVNEFLQSLAYPEIFAAGDNAYVKDPRNITKRLPLLAQIAFQQGRLLGKNVVAYIKKQHLKIYNPAPPVYLLPIGGRYAMMKVGNQIFKGRLLWYLRRIVDLRYSILILPFFKALHKWIHSHKVFIKND